MAANFQSVEVVAKMICVVNCPGGEPEHFALQLVQNVDFSELIIWSSGHGTPPRLPIIHGCLGGNCQIRSCKRHILVYCAKDVTGCALNMPKLKLDALDRKILDVLQLDGRISLAELATKVGLSASPCLRRVRILERDGVISRYVAVLDQRAVGLPVSVFVSIRLEKQKEEALDRFAKAIARWPEVLECYLMTGSRDYWLRVVVPDLDAYDRFVKQKLARLEGIASIESSFALEQVKYTNILPIP
jgi:Lrp/AsnC family transcriptional regulator, leucine-responsive regulatory protein